MVKVQSTNLSYSYLAAILVEFQWSANERAAM